MKGTIKKTAKGLILIIICLGFVSPTGAQDVDVKDLYMQNGTVMQCDRVWKGLGDFVWCGQGGNVKGYPAADVDLSKTFDLPIEVARLINQSRDCFEDHDWDGAIRSATAAITLDPKNEVAYTNRAGAYTQKGLLKEAVNDCNKALEINPFYALAYNNRGFALERVGQMHEALEDYDLSCRMGNELACKNLARVEPAKK